LRGSIEVHVRPDNGWPKFIGLLNYRTVRNDYPLIEETHAVASVLHIPINVLNAEPVREGAAQTLSACELVEPRVKRFIGVAAIVTCLRSDDDTEMKDQSSKKYLHYIRATVTRQLLAYRRAIFGALLWSRYG